MLSVQMGGYNEMVMRSTPLQTTLLSMQYGTDYLVEICQACLWVVQVSVILSACTPTNSLISRSSLRQYCHSASKTRTYPRPYLSPCMAFAIKSKGSVLWYKWHRHCSHLPVTTEHYLPRNNDSTDASKQQCQVGIPTLMLWLGQPDLHNKCCG